MRIAVLIVCSIFISSITFAQDAVDPDAHWLDNLNQASSLLREGKYEEALPVAEDTLEEYVELYGEEGFDYGYLANLLGTIYFGLSEYEEALPLYKDAARAGEKTFPKDSLELATILSNLAYTQIALFDFFGAMASLSHTVKIYQANPDVKPEKLFQAHSSYGKVAMASDYELARHNLDVAIDLAREIYKKKDQKLAMAKITRARLELLNGNLDEAERLYGKARESVSFSRTNFTWQLRSYWQDMALLQGLRGHSETMIRSYGKAGAGLIQPENASDLSLQLPVCPFDNAGENILTSAVVEIRVSKDGRAADPTLIYMQPVGSDPGPLFEAIHDWRFSKKFTELELVKRVGVRMQIGCETKEYLQKRENYWRSPEFPETSKMLTVKTAGNAELEDKLSKYTRASVSADLEDEEIYSALREQYLEIIKIARNIFDSDGPELVNYYRNLGRLALAADDAKTAQRYLRRAIRIAEKADNRAVSDLTGAHWDYAYCAYKVGHEDKEFDQYDSLIEVLEEMGRPQAEVLQAKMNFGKRSLRFSRVNYNRAEKYMIEVLSGEGADSALEHHHI